MFPLESCLFSVFFPPVVKVHPDTLSSLTVLCCVFRGLCSAPRWDGGAVSSADISGPLAGLTLNCSQLSLYCTFSFVGIFMEYTLSILFNTVGDSEESLVQPTLWKLWRWLYSGKVCVCVYNLLMRCKSVSVLKRDKPRKSGEWEQAVTYKHFGLKYKIESLNECKC